MLRASVVLSFAIATSLPDIGVDLGVSLEPLPALDRALDVGRRHRAFLDEAVRKHRRGRAVEEVEDAIVLALEPDPQLINLVPEQVRLGAAQLMSEFGEALDTHHALVLCFRRQTPQQVQNRGRAVRLAVENDPCSWHVWKPLSPGKFAKLRMTRKSLERRPSRATRVGAVAYRGRLHTCKRVDPDRWTASALSKRHTRTDSRKTKGGRKRLPWRVPPSRVAHVQFPLP